MSRGRRPGSLSRYKCCVCAAVVIARGGSDVTRCQPCKDAHRVGPEQHKKMRMLWHGGPAACGQVHVAIRDGLLPHPSTLTCADCEKPAAQYDHRDYNKPLQVAAVCRSCNLKRGPAIPLVGSVERLLARGAFPYRQGQRVAQLCRVMGKPDAIRLIPRRRLTLDDWHRIWPELIGLEGAPPVPAEAEPAQVGG